MVVQSKGRYTSKKEALDRAMKDGLWVVRCDDLTDSVEVLPSVE